MRTKSHFDDVAVSFLWDQWAQLGLSGAIHRRDTWVIDPEALLLLGLDIGARDPRLFEELLDWLRMNGKLVSAKRLRNLTDGDDRLRRLADGALAWAGMHESSLQLWARNIPDPSDAAALEPIGYIRIVEPDPAFAAFDLGWPRASASMKSTAADLSAPVALSLRLRALFGVGARAEIVRYLYTSGHGGTRVADIAHAAGSGKRNVQDALNDLTAAGITRRSENGNEHLYSIEPEPWDVLLGVTAPSDRALPMDWVRLLPAVAKVAHWFDDDARKERSDYLRASDARQLVASIGPELARAGVDVPDGKGVHAEDYLDVFDALVDLMITTLGPTSGAEPVS